jgi:hypothetical protein
LPIILASGTNTLISESLGSDIDGHKVFTDVLEYEALFCLCTE